MGEIVKAVYENGILRPLKPLNLREHQTVRVQVLSDEAAKDEGAEAVRVLVAAGLIHRPERTAPPPDPGSAMVPPVLRIRCLTGPGRRSCFCRIEDRGER